MGMSACMFGCLSLCAVVSDRFECSSTESAHYHWSSLYIALVHATVTRSR